MIERQPPVLVHLDRRGEFPLAEEELRARFGLAPRTAQALPAPLAQIAQQHELDGPAARARA